MRSFRSLLVLSGLVVGTVAVLYNYVLDDNAREQLKRALRQGIEFGRNVHGVITGSGADAERQRIARNKELVAEQWRLAGF